MSAAELHSFFPPRSDAGQSRRGLKSWFKSLAVQVLLLQLALVVGYALRFRAPSELRRLFEAVPINSVNEIVLLIAAVLAAMVLHESGHLIASLALCFQLMGASLGPLRFQLLHGKWKLTFWPKQLFTASISAAPKTLEHWRGAMMVVVAAGPVATLATAVGGCYFLHQKPASIPLTVFLTFLVQVNVLLFVIGLIPNGADARSRNDARLLWILASNGRAVEEMEMSVRLALLVNQGIRPQDYPQELMLRTAQWHGRPEGELIFAQALVRWAIDSDESTLAEAWDARALALSECCDSRLRNHALASSACMDVLFRDDFETARNKFAQVDTTSLFPKCFEYRARAARQIALGRNHRASAEIIRAQYALPRGIVAYELERKLLEILHLRVLLPPGPAHLSRTASCGA